MVKPVSLSDPAFAALRKEKGANESDSDVVLRLIREARAKRKDPMSFVRSSSPSDGWDAKEFAQFRKKMNEADVRKARARWSELADP